MISHENQQILQPLRIPAGWKIIFNDFTVLEPAQCTGSDFDFWENFVEDMLMHEPFYILTVAANCLYH